MKKYNFSIKFRRWKSIVQYGDQHFNSSFTPDEVEVIMSNWIESKSYNKFFKKWDIFCKFKSNRFSSYTEYPKGDITLKKEYHNDWFEKNKNSNNKIDFIDLDHQLSELVYDCIKSGIINEEFLKLIEHKIHKDFQDKISLEKYKKFLLKNKNDEKNLNYNDKPEKKDISNLLNNSEKISPEIEDYFKIENYSSFTPFNKSWLKDGKIDIERINEIRMDNEIHGRLLNSYLPITLEEKNEIIKLLRKKTRLRKKSKWNFLENYFQRSKNSLFKIINSQNLDKKYFILDLDEISEDDYYIGDIKNNRPHGQGIFKWSDKVKYVGEWKEGILHGRGVLENFNQFTYIGSFNEGLYHGKGTYIVEDVLKYEGEWEMGKELNIKCYDKNNNYFGEIKNKKWDE